EPFLEFVGRVPFLCAVGLMRKEKVVVLHEHVVVRCGPGSRTGPQRVAAGGCRLYGEDTDGAQVDDGLALGGHLLEEVSVGVFELDRKSTRLNSSHVSISYAVFCLK